jgi:Fe-S cluster assembly ATP-binding protein
MDELIITDLHVAVEGKEILKGVTLKVKKGEIVALMGPNGSGKSTLAQVIAGNPKLAVTKGSISWKKKGMLKLSPTERSIAGLFLSFQYPSEIPGVTIANFLRTAYNARRKAPMGVIDFHRVLQEKMELLEVPDGFKTRYLNDGFSGGEKKKCEVLQLAVLEPDLAILDETDSGTDVDALRILSEGIMKVKNKTGMGILLITHYERILRYVSPDRVLIMQGGKIVREGGLALAKEIEKKGYG